MNFLFVHNNFPAQFRNLAEELGKDSSHRLVAIGAHTAQPIKNVVLHRYELPAYDVSSTHPFARRFDAECRRAEQVLFTASALAVSGFSPDYVLAHCGWGETIPLRAVFPKAKIVIYCEFFYRAEGQDVHFDRESAKLGADGVAGLQCKNASTLIALTEGDLGVSPTFWQRSTFPKEFQEKIQVVHEGVDLEMFRPDKAARFPLPGGKVLSRADEIVTFASRNLEPMRGYHVFMRAASQILRSRPQAEVVIVGGEGSSYGPPPPKGTNWKAHYLEENRETLDLSRVHFVGRLPYHTYIRLLQVSSVHVYLTYPFVLSWSLLEAMATGCEIVASDTAPVREVVKDRENGVLVPFHDSEALAEAAVEALSNRPRFPVHGRAARETIAARYDKRACVREALQALGIAARSDIEAAVRSSQSAAIQRERALASSTANRAADPHRLSSGAIRDLRQ